MSTYTADVTYYDKRSGRETRTDGTPVHTVESLDLAVWPLFAEMTRRGIAVDPVALETLRADVENELDAQEAALEAYAGRELNPYSTHDVAGWLEEEGLAGGRKTRGGATATDERALSKLLHIHPVPGCVLECRGLRKLLSTFIEPIIERVKVAGPVVHPRWRLTKVKSGRPSMEDPNLLAFPTRDAWGKRVRDCFVARPGYMLVSVDFSQIEPRVAAGLSGDEALKRVFAEGRDLYADMARRIFRITDDIPDAAFKKEPHNTRMRQPSKTILLGCTLYGMQPPLLYDTLIKIGCGTATEPFFSEEACEDFVRRRFDPYPGLKVLFEATVAKARSADGWAETMEGRRRFLPALLCEGHRWPAAKLREEAERQAFNHLIQGSAQEIMKRAMLRADVVPKSWPLLQVYDEMVYEVCETTADITARLLAESMATELEGVKIPAAYSVARSWGALK